MMLNYTDSLNGSTENARHETTAQSKCRGGNCEKRKLWHNVAGGGKCGTSLYGQRKEHLEFNVPFQHKYGYIRDEHEHDNVSVCSARHCTAYAAKHQLSRRYSQKTPQ